MHRRDVLRMCGLAATGILAGCLGTGSDQLGPRRTVQRARTQSGGSSVSLSETGDLRVTKRTSSFVDSYPEDEPFTEVVVGKQSQDQDNPHGVRVFNKTNAVREVSLTVETGNQAETLVFEGEGTIAPGASLAVAIWNPARYRVSLEVSRQGDDREKAFTVPRDAWQTGGAQHNVSIRQNSIEVTFVSTG